MPVTASYVGEFGSGEITWAMRLAVDPTTGDVLVGDTDATAILRYDSGGTLLDTISPPVEYGDGISGISVTSAGKIWATMFYTRNDSPPSSVPSLYRLAADGTYEAGFYFGPFSPTPKVLEPNYVHVGSDGKVYVASSYWVCYDLDPEASFARAVGVRHASDGTWEADIGGFIGCGSPFPVTPPDGVFAAPVSIMTDSTGSVYIADGYNLGYFDTQPRYRTIHKFNSSGVFQYKVGGVGTDPGQFAPSGNCQFYYDSPQGMAVDAEDNLYVADAWGGKVNVYDNTGAFLLSFGTEEGLSFPGDVAFGADGLVYVVDGDRVLSYLVAEPAGLGVRGVSVETCGLGSSSPVCE